MTDAVAPTSPGPRVWQDAFAGLFENDFTNALDAILAPTLVVHGEQDALAARAHQDALLARAAVLVCA